MALYTIKRKHFHQEIEALDIYFKKKFCGVCQNDLLEYVRSFGTSAPNDSLFEAQRKWIMDEILTSSGIAERARAIKFALKLAQYFYTERNFPAYFAVLSALEERAVKRLRKSWYQVPHKYTKWYLQHLQLSSTPAYFVKIAGEQEGLCFPYLYALKQEYQYSPLEKQKEIEALLLKCHKTLSHHLSDEKEDSSTLFIRRIHVWKKQTHVREINFLERSFLLE